MKSLAANDPEQAALDVQHDQRNPELVHALQAYMERNNLDNNTRDRLKVARNLGYKDGTAVYRYLAAKPEGDVAKFELRLASFLSNELRIEGGGDLIDDTHSFIIPSMFAFLNQVRSAGHIGVAHGPAGTGKTCAARLYTAKHKSNTLYAHVWCWTAGKSDLARELATRAGLVLKKNETHEAALRRHFQDAPKGMMFVLDNAQRLTPKARDWLADFLDFTGVPIALVGNPEIEQQWARCDQHKRRVGLRRDVSIDLFDPKSEHNTSARTVHYLIQRHLPEAAHTPEVHDKALSLLNQRGSGACGAVVMHARLARLMLAGGKVKDPSRAFDLAKTQLINAA